METHVLNGDALAEKFPMEGDLVVCRECLIDGPVAANSLEKLWRLRASYLLGKFDEDESSYFNQVKTEFDKLSRATSPVNLWFEHDLFCQANMWFVLYYLKENKINLPVFRVMPPAEAQQIWSGFGSMKKADLLNCFERRIQLSEKDTQLGLHLWRAYQAGDLVTIKKISFEKSPTFPLLREVCEAHIQRFPRSGLGRPQQKLKQILESGETDFKSIFIEFWKTEGIYGFGDSQVKSMLASL
jgi:hypothetical protein